MTTLNISSREFLSNYIFHPLSSDLTKRDKIKALVSSVALGIITLGILHIVCLIKYRNHIYTIGASGQAAETASKVNNIATPQLAPLPQVRDPNVSPKAKLTLMENTVESETSNLTRVDIYRKIGEIYRHGAEADRVEDKVEKDIDKAIFWLKKAIDDVRDGVTTHSGTARDILADIYIKGEAISNDPKELYDLANKFHKESLKKVELTKIADAIHDGRT